MASLKIDKLQIAYVLKTPDRVVGAEIIAMTPHEVVQGFPVEELKVTKTLSDVPGEIILGLYTNADNKPALFRLKDQVPFDLTGQDFLYGALKIYFTFTSDGNQTVYTPYYPIEADTPASTPPAAVGIDWKWVLKKEEITTTYRLIYFHPSRPPGDIPICEQLECETTNDPDVLFICQQEDCPI